MYFSRALPFVPDPQKSWGMQRKKEVLTKLNDVEPAAQDILSACAKQMVRPSRQQRRLYHCLLIHSCARVRPI
jgi:hypothetical protein